ncbi:hypothetical protein [Carnimonas bestiolae]|uniref:hypothetical protein n=1 Tax=Carnimonas bestiolae TaxID=3402172 RepID=UPI003EDC7057
MNVLVVFQLLPEETHQYLIRNVSNDSANDLKQIHGKYVNCDDFTEYQQLTWDGLNSGIENSGKERNIEDVTDTPVENPDLVIVTGIVL